MSPVDVVAGMASRSALGLVGAGILATLVVLAIAWAVWSLWSGEG